jgi:hypothetical protein
MKKWIIVLLAASFFTACGAGGKSPSKLASEVCDCYKKANAMDAADPKRADEQNLCVKMQMENWNSIKDDQKKADEFNKIIGDCGKDMIQNSMPK